MELVGRVFNLLQLSNVKPEQMKAVKRIIDHEVFVFLPAGYGKSTCFQSWPLVYESGTPGIRLCFITADPSHTRRGTLRGE